MWLSDNREWSAARDPLSQGSGGTSYSSSRKKQKEPQDDPCGLRCLLPAASQLCILSGKGLYKMGPLSVLFNFSMGLCLSKLHANSVRKRNATKLLLRKRKKAYFMRRVSC